MGYGYGIGYGWIFMVVFWVLLVGVALWALTRVLPSSSGEQPLRGGRETPLEILQRRLANGEVDPDEYVRIREQLTRPEDERGGARR